MDLSYLDWIDNRINLIANLIGHVEKDLQDFWLIHSLVSIVIEWMKRGEMEFKLCNQSYFNQYFSGAVDKTIWFGCIDKSWMNWRGLKGHFSLIHWFPSKIMMIVCM